LEGSQCPFIRFLASSNEFQFQYSICKNSNIKYVDTPLTAQNINQRLLLYYLDFYYRFSELDKDERPSPEIMRNHYLCDEWVRIYLLNLDRKKKESKTFSHNKKVESSEYDF
jgi:hypothetical protein